jgi:hypothetical protein
MGVALTLAFALPLASAQASTSAADAHMASGSVCVIAEKAFSTYGNEKIVTATSQTCYSSYSQYLAAQHAAGTASPDIPAVSRNIGYGCTGADFGGSCYYFAVSGSGCDWVWNTLNSATKNRLDSMEAINGCTGATVYSLPYQSGQSIGCHNECQGLGVIRDHDESLYI